MIVESSYVLAGAVTGFVVGMTGVGGGALMTPILLLLFGIAPATAIATDLWFAAITKVAAVAVHHRAGQVDWQVARRLWLGSLPVALAVVVVVAMGATVQRLGWLTQVIAWVVALTAAGLLFGPWLVRRLHTRDLQPSPCFMRVQGPLTVVAGGFLGLIVALTSVGAGALGSILLLALYPQRLPPHRLVATDLLHAIPLAVVAGLGYLVAGMVDGALLLNLLLGSIPAAIAGSYAARFSPPGWLRTALALVLAATAVKLLMV